MIQLAEAQANLTHPDTETYLLPKESTTILGNLDSEDQITFMAKQKRRSGDVIYPGIVITTLMKLIVVERPLGGLKSHIIFIPYTDIASVRIMHGVMVSSIFFRLNGTPRESNSPLKVSRGDGEIKALDTADADILFSQLNNIITINSKQEAIAKAAAVGIQQFQSAPAKTYEAQTAAAPDYYPHKKSASTEFAGLHREPIVAVDMPKKEPESTAFVTHPGENGATVISSGLKSEQKAVSTDDMLIFKTRKQKAQEAQTQEKPAPPAPQQNEGLLSRLGFVW